MASVGCDHAMPISAGNLAGTTKDRAQGPGTVGCRVNAPNGDEGRAVAVLAAQRCSSVSSGARAIGGTNATSQDSDTANAFRPDLLCGRSGRPASAP